MKYFDKHYRTVEWIDDSIRIIDQNLLPFDFKVYDLTTLEQVCLAITEMNVRGAGAIGVTAAFGMALAAISAEDTPDYQERIAKAAESLKATRPTAQNLFTAVDVVYKAAKKGVPQAIAEAQHFAATDLAMCQAMGKHGATLLKPDFRMLTHCNAGWLGFTDYGSALAPVYYAQQNGVNGFVYVDETRPRSQGARLTAWELYHQRVPHTLIADNAAAYFMAQNKIDIVIVGADRIAANGDVANKIGTLEKAIIAKYYSIPFYVAAPLSTFDFECKTGADIPIENREPEELLYFSGPNKNGKNTKVRVASPGSTAQNPAFDVTPANLITGIITPEGIFAPSDIKKLKGLK